MDINKLTSEIPDSLKLEEAITRVKELLHGKDTRANVAGSMATMAANLIPYCLPYLTSVIEQMNQQLGAEYPHGDIIKAGALFAAAQALVRIIIKQDPQTAIHLAMMMAMANDIEAYVAEQLMNLPDDIGVRESKDGFTVVVPKEIFGG